MPTIQEALLYKGMEPELYADDPVVQTNAARALRTARQTLLGAVGDDVETYLPDDPRVAELVLIYFDDLYSERGVSAKVAGAVRRLVFDMEQQLRLELARAKEARAKEAAGI